MVNITRSGKKNRVKIPSEKYIKAYKKIKGAKNIIDYYRLL